MVIYNNKKFVYTAQFNLEYDQGVFNLVSCESKQCSLCSNNETKPTISKYLNNQYMLDNTCLACPDGWYFSSGRCFKVFDDSLKYDQAQSSCQSMNAYLAILNTNAKFDFVKSLIQDYSYFVK